MTGTTTGTKLSLHDLRIAFGPRRVAVHPRHAVVAAKRALHATIAVQKFCAISLG